MSTPQQTAKLKPDDFEEVRVIGRGAFAQVKIVRKKDDNNIYAMKIMSKVEMVKKKQVDHIRAERDILTKVDSPWIVQLVYSFQDDKYLYLVMDFLQGGDLMTILINHEILTFEQTRFYIAETALAIDAVHQLSYIHRDLKPDNILIDKSGHVKLSDFGLCKAVTAEDIAQDLHHQSVIEYSQNGEIIQVSQDDPSQSHFAQLNQHQRTQEFRRRARKLAFSTVGTPDYIAPEVFAQTGYDEGCDWWSLGVILYECLIGCPPFFADDARQTCSNILNFQRTLHFPSDFPLDPVAHDLIVNLICHRDQRLGFQGIKEHPFFAGLDWGNIRASPPPFLPQLESEIDAKYFDNFDEVAGFDHELEPVENGEGLDSVGQMQNAQNHINNAFINYTFKRPNKSNTTSLNDLFSSPQ